MLKRIYKASNFSYLFNLSESEVPNLLNEVERITLGTSLLVHVMVGVLANLVLLVKLRQQQTKKTIHVIFQTQSLSDLGTCLHYFLISGIYLFSQKGFLDSIPVYPYCRIIYFIGLASKSFSSAIFLVICLHSFYRLNNINVQNARFSLKGIKKLLLAVGALCIISSLLSTIRAKKMVIRHAFCDVDVEGEMELTYLILAYLQFSLFLSAVLINLAGTRFFRNIESFAQTTAIRECNERMRNLYIVILANHIICWLPITIIMTMAYAGVPIDDFEELITSRISGMCVITNPIMSILLLGDKPMPKHMPLASTFSNCSFDNKNPKYPQTPL